MAVDYPLWRFYPYSISPPAWTGGVVKAFTDARGAVDSRTLHGISSDRALAHIRPALEGLGFTVESGKKKTEKILRPVLFGEQGRPVVSYEVDAYHPGDRVAVEVEAGRGAANNADYRDIIRASLMVDADYLVMAMMLRYTAGQSLATKSYEVTSKRIDAIYASDRLQLPLKGILLVGY